MLEVVLKTSPRPAGASATVPVGVRLDGVPHERLKVTDTDGSRTGTTNRAAAGSHRA
ncbi:hypothetical protein [Streptomyces californicus]|uniref:hypothetical protein n=1 Tax=Streptomyces californicus TaxID=67351 RepID=UPI0037974855